MCQQSPVVGTKSLARFQPLKSTQLKIHGVNCFRLRMTHIQTVKPATWFEFWSKLQIIISNLVPCKLGLFSLASHVPDVVDLVWKSTYGLNLQDNRLGVWIRSFQTQQTCVVLKQATTWWRDIVETWSPCVSQLSMWHKRHVSPGQQKLSNH